MTAFKIKSIKAFIATEDDGTEGIIAMKMPNGLMMPLVYADDAHGKALKPYVIKLAKALGKKAMLAQFSVRENIEEIEPRGR